MKYRMIGIDLDGTLLGPHGRVSERDAAAVAAAQDAGVLVVPCTGRGWRESRAAMTCVRGDGPGVFACGSVVNQIQSGRSLDLACLESHLAMQIVDLIRTSPDAVLVFRDANLVGHDYLVTGEGTLSPNSQWWFEKTGATLHFKNPVTMDDMHHALRVGVVAPGMRVATLAQTVRTAMSGRVYVQSFEAVQMPDDSDSIHVLEVFARGVDKWRGLRWVAQQQQIPVDRIAVIGDEINDVAAVQSAGCGIAMGNAIPAVRDVARYTTSTNQEAGVAFAIEQLMSGKWN